VLNQVCGSSLVPISGCTNARGKTSTQVEVQKTPFLKASLYWLCTTNPASLWTGCKNKQREKKKTPQPNNLQSSSDETNTV